MEEKLCNVHFGFDEYFEPFKVRDYLFSSLAKDRESCFIPADRDNTHKENAMVEFNQNQESSVLYTNMIINDRQNRKRDEMALIDDILTLGSILTGNNWILSSRKKMGISPVSQNNTLSYISCKNEIEKHLNTAW